MDASELALRMRWGLSTARRRCAIWIRLQARGGVPTVTLRRTGTRGRPGYEVDRATFERWLRGELRAETAANETR